MSGKAIVRIKTVLYAAVLVLAELLQTSVFGELSLPYAPCAMPLAVACIALFEGAEKGVIYGLAGGCLWAWSSALSYYGAWCIVALAFVGAVSGMITERFLLRGLKTALCMAVGAILVTEGVYVLVRSFAGTLPAGAFFTYFLPEFLLSMMLCLLFYAVVSLISRIGGSHG